MQTVSSLTVCAVLTGSALLALSAFWLMFPATAGRVLDGFPRGVWAGRILAAVAIGLSAYLLLTEGFEWVDKRRTLLLIAAPAAVVLVCLLMDELLAVRAFGGLLLLAPYWILGAAFEHTSSSRLVMTVFAYLMVVAGMILVWSPYLFRIWVSRVRPGARGGLIFGACGSVAGALMIVLGLLVY